MRTVLSVVAALVVATSAAAQTAPAAFTNVEVVGWDFSSFEEKIRGAVSKANAPGAAEALAERAEFFYGAGHPAFYKYALGDFRHVLPSGGKYQIRVYAKRGQGYYELKAELR